MARTELVVWHSNTSLQWIEQIPAEYDVTIYHCGSGLDLQLRRPVRFVLRPGSGFSAMLHFILLKTSFKGGHTVFVPVDPQVASPDFNKLVEREGKWADLQPLSWRSASNPEEPPSNLLDQDTAAYINGYRIRPELFSLFTWETLQFREALSIGHHYRQLHSVPKAINIAADFFLRCGCSDKASLATQHSVGKFAYGGLCAIRQSCLAHIDRKMVEHALQAADTNALYAHVLERLWLHIFGEPFALTNNQHNGNITYIPLNPRFHAAATCKPTLTIVPNENS